MLLDVALKSLLALLLAAVALAYGRGWARMHALGHEPARWRAASYAAGLATIALAVLALDSRAEESFAAHMIQHLLLIMVAAPLVLLGNPLPLVLWGAPPGLRRALATTLRPGARLRAALSLLTWAPVAGTVYVVTLWGWHVPLVYDAAVEHEALHAVEHALFFAAATLFWWPIVEPAPRLRPRLHPGFQLFYLLLATALPERAFYPHYVTMAAILGTSAVDDQALGGGLMWTMGHMFLLPILVILYRLSRQSARAPEGAAA